MWFFGKVLSELCFWGSDRSFASSSLLWALSSVFILRFLSNRFDWKACMMYGIVVRNMRSARNQGLRDEIFLMFWRCSECDRDFVQGILVWYSFSRCRKGVELEYYRLVSVCQVIYMRSFVCCCIWLCVSLNCHRENPFLELNFVEKIRPLN